MSGNLWAAGFVVDLWSRSYCFLLYGEFALITEMSGIGEVSLVRSVLCCHFFFACMRVLMKLWFRKTKGKFKKSQTKII